MKPIYPLKELIIVSSVLISTIAFVWLSVGRTMDINISDSYFVVKTSWITSILPPFLWLTTIIYLIRARINHFKKRLQNIILLLSCLGLNILMLSYFKIAAEFTGMASRESAVLQYKTLPTPDSTIYPSDGIVQILFIIQIILLILLVIIAVITGKNYKTNVQEIL